ncbi:MAG TPA: tRNA pseudouridine(55) synthase TruB [Nitriliruptoraceae bacterium]|nr:tRNA pseudouridine(55) synthase TruB [Nitriliruptoraceae bacterium]
MSRRHDPDIAGVVVVDKPAGMTSHDVVGEVRRALGMRRVGHTGTLDPAATGVLVCAVGRATRLVPVLQAGRKTYAATAVFGVETDSQDADGTVIAEADASHLTEHAICEVMTRFIGPLEQVPPMVSAVKVGGRRLHELAREGIEVERDARHVTIHDLVMEDWEPGAHPLVSFLVTCSAGTYIRTLAHDIGAELGVGGSLVALRRVANGPFVLEQAMTMDEVRAAGRDHALRARLLSPAAATAHLPRIPVGVELALRMAHGQRVPLDELAHEPLSEDPVAVVDPDDALVGIFTPGQGVLQPDVVMARPEDYLAAARAPGTSDAATAPAGTSASPTSGRGLESSDG